MKFRKKPVVVEAVKWTGSNTVEISEFMGLPLDKITAAPFVNKLVIHTLEGDMRADVGDWIIQGVNGEFYPCKPDIFIKTYDPAEPEKDGALAQFYGMKVKTSSLVPKDEIWIGTEKSGTKIKL